LIVFGAVKSITPSFLLSAAFCCAAVNGLSLPSESMSLAGDATLATEATEAGCTRKNF